MEKILDYNKKKFFRYSGKGNKFDQKKTSVNLFFLFLIHTLLFRLRNGDVCIFKSVEFQRISKKKLAFFHNTVL